VAQYARGDSDAEPLSSSRKSRQKPTNAMRGNDRDIAKIFCTIICKRASRYRFLGRLSVGVPNRKRNPVSGNQCEFTIVIITVIIIIYIYIARTDCTTLSIILIQPFAVYIVTRDALRLGSTKYNMYGRRRIVYRAMGL